MSRTIAILAALLVFTSIEASAGTGVILHSIKNGVPIKIRGLKKLIVNCPSSDKSSNKMIKNLYRDFTKAAALSFRKYGAPKKITFGYKMARNGAVVIRSNKKIKLPTGPYRGAKQRFRVVIQPQSDCSFSRVL